MASLRYFLRIACPLVAAIAAVHVSAPSLAQVKSSGGEAEARVNRVDNGVAGAIPSRSRDRGPGLMGRVVWGDAGALRLVLLRWPPPGERIDRSLRVRIVNEGTNTFTIQPADTWAVRTEKGASIAATRKGASPGESLLIPAKGTLEVDLDMSESPRHRIASLEYHSGLIGGLVEIRTPWLDPQPKLVVPPEYPASALKAGVMGQVNLSALVGTDGRVEEIYVLSPPADRDPHGLRAAAENAVREWIFDPAMENREPQRGLREVSLNFSGSPVMRAVVPLPPVETALRLNRLLQDSYPLVLALPRSNGFLVREEARQEGDVARVSGWLVRFGDQWPGKSAWITVAGFTLGQRQTSAGCRCAEWTADNGSGGPLMSLILNGLGVEATQTTMLAPQGGDIIPSGNPEPESVGTWRRDTLRRVLRTSLRQAVEPNAVSREELSWRPGEEEVVRPLEPMAVTGDVHAPEKITEVPSAYPEAARLARTEGKVILEAVIDTNGDVADLKVLRSVPGLDQAAMDAVCCWKYRPATMGGKPVPAYFTVVVDYRLTKS